MDSILIHITPKNINFDPLGKHTASSISKHLDIDCGNVCASKVFLVTYPMSIEQAKKFASDCLCDPVVDSLSVGRVAELEGFSSFISIAKKPGVTDDEGISAQKTLADYLAEEIDTKTQHIFSQNFYYIENKLAEDKLKLIASTLLGNGLIHHFEYGDISSYRLYIPSVEIHADSTVETVNIFVSDDELMKLSQEKVLSLNLEEMKAIQNYYTDEKVKARRKELGLPDLPTDCELEILAQTWSEHCKHKEFAALIDFEDMETGEKKQIDSLFKTYIKGSTDAVAQKLKAKNNNWLIKVFSDNAGVVDLDEKHTFVWKVETHNSPSAIDPYGGAITGILGNNRDPLGTGVGGGRLLFNTNVLCFGDPGYEGELAPTQLHPRRIFEGVVKGIEDGGNKSGIPTVNGSIIFDERYAGKPLVYCGTGGIMPKSYKGKNSWEKPIDAGDRIIMAGGRVGKDGIHGATFSSAELNEHSPASAVQIGSPITQKLAADFLERATERGLIKCSTDNGAGGLSSSIGELADISGGAFVELEKVPLKYSGLKPWEIFVSESQERMTLVVEKENEEALFALADEMEVELTDIGEFTSDGILTVSYNGIRAASLDLEFLHDGVPRKHLVAEFVRPQIEDNHIPQCDDYTDLLHAVLNSLNVCSKEWVIRQYDHEVKGKTIIKPLMADGDSPQDAAVVRTSFDSYEGVAVSNGIIPRYGDIDAYQMSAGSFDEAVRQIISVGGRLPNTIENDGIFWTVNDNFCMPDSVYDEVSNPDGKEKLGKLVRICDALYDMSTYFAIPMTSGKDSMKNDFKAGKKHISVPPTILYSMAAKIADVRKTVTSCFKASGDAVYLVGETYSELGATEAANALGLKFSSVPKVRMEEAYKLYLKMMQAHEKGLVQSSHDISDGGLAACIAECCFGTGFGADILLESELSAFETLFSESHSRFIVSVKADDVSSFEEIFGERCKKIGSVNTSASLIITHNEKEVVSETISRLCASWKKRLEIME